MKHLVLLAMASIFLASLVLGGCSTIQNIDASSDWKQKSSYEHKRNEGSGGYY